MYFFQIGNIPTVDNVTGTGAIKYDNGNVHFTAQDGTTELTINFVTQSSMLNSPYQLASNVRHVPASELTAQDSSFFDLFFGTAYADGTIEIVNQPTDYEDVSDLPDGQNSEVTLSSGHWSHTWHNLPTTEEVGGVTRKVYYYVVETNVPSDVTRITYTEGNKDAEGRVYRITIENKIGRAHV